MNTPFVKPAVGISVARGAGPRDRRVKQERAWRVIVSGLPREAPGLQATPLSSSGDAEETTRTSALLRDLTSRLLRAQDEERRRIARDLHDSTCQTLLAASLTLNQLKAHVSPGGAAPFAAVETALADSMRELRTLSYLLHPPLLEECGLTVALREFLRGFAQRSGIAVQMRLAPDIGRLACEIENMLFRIVQESLTNVHRHSGSVVARVRLMRMGNRIAVCVGDRGRGMTQSVSTDAAPMGVGIAGMRARVQQFGGDLRIRSGRWGTMVRATLKMADAPYAAIALDRRHRTLSEGEAGGRLRR
jgi:two-component system, NarL family, sensor kinase